MEPTRVSTAEAQFTQHRSFLLSNPRLAEFLTVAFARYQTHPASEPEIWADMALYQQCQQGIVIDLARLEEELKQELKTYETLSSLTQALGEGCKPVLASEKSVKQLLDAHNADQTAGQAP